MSKRFDAKTILRFTLKHTFDVRSWTCERSVKKLKIYIYNRYFSNEIYRVMTLTFQLLFFFFFFPKIIMRQNENRTTLSFLQRSRNRAAYTLCVVKPRATRARNTSRTLLVKTLFLRALQRRLFVPSRKSRRFFFFFFINILVTPLLYNAYWRVINVVGYTLCNKPFFNGRNSKITRCCSRRARRFCRFVLLWTSVSAVVYTMSSLIVAFYMGADVSRVTVHGSTTVLCSI